MGVFNENVIFIRPSLPTLWDHYNFIPVGVGQSNSLFIDSDFSVLDSCQIVCYNVIYQYFYVNLHILTFATSKFSALFIVQKDVYAHTYGGC